MAHPKDTKNRARQMYVQTRQSLPVIAISLDVPEGTLRRWKADAAANGDDWDTARAAQMVKGEGFEAVVATAVEDFTVMFQATMEGLRDDDKLPHADRAKIMASLSDAFNKMIGAAGRANPRLSRLAIATDVLKRFAEFVHAEFPHHSAVFLDVLEPFGQELSRAYNETP